MVIMDSIQKSGAIELQQSCFTYEIALGIDSQLHFLVSPISYSPFTSSPLTLDYHLLLL